jgi:hypothetical protein
MSERTARAWQFYIDDMVTFSTKVLAYVDGLDQAAFVADERTFDATLRNLELLGEAASHVPDHARTAHPEVPWRMIIATRNVRRTREAPGLHHMAATAARGSTLAASRHRLVVGMDRVIAPAGPSS